MVKLRLYGLIRAAAGKREIEANGSTVLEALHAAIDPLTDVRSLVFDEDGDIYPLMRVFVDNERVNDLGLKLEPGSVIHIIPVVEGG